MTTVASTSTSPIAVPSQALGAIEVRPVDLITACEPLAGFPDCSSYTLIEHTRGDGASAGGSVFWLQAVERPFHAFVVPTRGASTPSTRRRSPRPTRRSSAWAASRTPASSGS